MGVVKVDAEDVDAEEMVSLKADAFVPQKGFHGKESIAKLAEWPHKQGMETLLEVNHRTKGLRERDTAQGKGTQRMNFGAHFFYQGPLGDREKSDET